MNVSHRITAGSLVLVSLLIGGCDDAPRRLVAGGDADRGRMLVGRHGCAACHVIPGVPGATGTIGPPLVDLARRGYIAGVLPNTPADLVRWLRDPPAVDPRTTMPNLGLSEAQAADVAAYLYSLP